MCTYKDAWILAMVLQWPWLNAPLSISKQNRKRTWATIPANFTPCMVTFYNKYIELYVTALLTWEILTYLCSDIVLSIDYEYASMNFLPHDIGNHFCEYAGIQIFISFLIFSCKIILRWNYAGSWHGSQLVQLRFDEKIIKFLNY